MTIKEAESIVRRVWDPFSKKKIDNNRWELARLTILEAIGRGTHHLTEVEDGSKQE